MLTADTVQDRARRNALIRYDAAIYCVRTLIFEAKYAQRSRFHVRKEVSQDDDRSHSPSSTSKTKSISSVMDIVSGSQYPSKEKKKYPKELIKLFEDALKKVIMRQEPQYDDVQVRSTFGAFYAYYVSDAFQKSMKDNRKIEDLVLMFFSKATGELQKRQPEADTKQTVIVHVAKFVRLLLQVVRANRLAASDSELVHKLTEYEKRLLQNAQYLAPASISSNELGETQPSIDLCVHNIVALQRLASLLSMSDIDMQELVDSVAPEVTEDAALRDLKLMLEQVQTQSGYAYASKDFSDENSYQHWRQQELAHLTSSILRLTSVNPHLAKATSNGPDKRATERLSRQTPSRANSYSSDVSQTSNRLSMITIASQEKQNKSLNLFYSPHNSFEAYKDLLRSALLEDCKASGPAEGEQDESIFSRASTLVLQQCRDRWRVGQIAHRVFFANVASEAFIEGTMTLDDLDRVFHEVDTQNIAQDRLLTIDLESSYKKALLSLNDSLFRDLYAEVQAIYTKQIDLRVLTFMDEYIYSDACFLDSATSSARMFDELEAGLKEVAENRYRSHRDATCSPAQLEILSIVNLAECLQKDINKFQKQYRVPLLDVIDVSTIFLATVLTQYMHDLKPLLEQCYRNARLQGVEFAIEDMFSLYHSVSAIDSLLKKAQPKFLSPVSIDLYFRPFVLKWLQQAHESILSLVSRATEADAFEKHDTDALSEDCCSESIILLFKSFTQHLSYLRNLSWPDEYWGAKFITILIHTISSAVREYCLLIQQLFAQECKPSIPDGESSETHIDTIQQRLLLRARETLAKRESIEPFIISSSACVKLNNIVSAKTRLNALEASVNSVALTSIIEKFEGQRGSWAQGQSVLFSVKIISAENLIACDANGYSDPYVVLSDQKGKRIGKTRTLYTNLNPRWDESFDIATNEAMWLAATIWDRDQTGEHEVCGRCFFKLDPPSFHDMIPKELSINLDTQGTLKLRITMEIESEESTFYFARAFKYLSRAEKDMCRAIVDRMTPFMDTALSRHNLKSLHAKSQVIDATLGSAYNLLSKAGFANQRLSAHQNQKNSPMTNRDIEAPIEPLMQYLDNNFKTLDDSLNRAAFISVLSRLWDHVVASIENIIVPQLSLRSTKSKRPLTEEELDTCYKWLGFLKDTFGGDGGGLTPEELQTPRYHELLSIRFFYFDDTDELMQECEQMVASSSAKERQMFEKPLILRQAFNLGTIKLNREERRARERALATSENIILRILRLRGDARAQAYVKDRTATATRQSKQSSFNSSMTRQTTIHSRSSHG